MKCAIFRIRLEGKGPLVFFEAYLHDERRLLMGKKFHSVITICSLVVTALFLLATGGSAAPMIWKLATSAPDNNITLTAIEGGGLSSEHTVAVVFKKLVEERTGRNIQVNIYPNSQLGDEPELWQQLKDGIIQVSTASCMPLSNFVPQWSAFMLPYLTNSPEVMYRVLEGPVGEQFKKLTIDKIGVRILGWSFLGFRNFTNNTRPIRSPADMKGLKIRVTQSPEAVKMVEGLGAQATPISWSELYSALQQGVVDGEENPLSMIEQAKLYEVQKYLTLDGHTLGVLPIAVNEKVFNSLSPEYKDIVKDSAQQAIAVFRAQLYLGNTLWIDDLKQKKMQIYVPNAAEYKQFQDAAQKMVIPYVRSKIGNEWVDKVIKAVKDAEKAYYER